MAKVKRNKRELLIYVHICDYTERSQVSLDHATQKRRVNGRAQSSISLVEQGVIHSRVTVSWTQGTM